MTWTFLLGTLKLVIKSEATKFGLSSFKNGFTEQLFSALQNTMSVNALKILFQILYLILNCNRNSK